MAGDDDKDARETATDKGPAPVAVTRSTESDRALVVLDMSVERCRGSAAVTGAAEIVRFIQGELRYFRERGRLVVFATHDGGPIIPELTPRSDEITLATTVPSAFFATDLDAVLRDRGIHRVTLVGVETHTAVLLTAGDAIARGYEVVVPDPCVIAGDVDAHEVALRLLRTMWQHAPVQMSAGQTPVDTITDMLV